MRERSVLLISSPEFGWFDLRMALRSLEGVRVAGEARSACQARELATAARPDVIISAATLDGQCALPFLTVLHRQLALTSKVVVFAARLDPAELAALDRRHFTGYLLWSDLSPETLPHCLAALIGSDIVVASPAVAAMLGAACRRSPEARTEPVPLNEREQAVLRRLSEGCTQEHIAQIESLSLRTVERIVGALEVRLDAPSQFVLGMKAARLGLLY